MEAYWADNGTYAGATLEALRGYDPSIAAVRIAGPLSKQTYCLESTVGAVSYYYQPGSELLEGTCANPAQPTSTRKPPAPPEYDARTNVRAAIPAVEAYKADNGTYAGMTAKKLRGKYDYGLPVFVVVQAGAKTYCIESAHAGETFHYAGPQGPVQPGRCPR
jgi:hypothetical protein